MARTVVFSMLQEAGHLHPTFKLARALQRRGLDVAYFAAPGLRPMVRDQGFRVLPWFDDLWFEPDAGDEPLWRKRRRVTRQFQEMIRRLDAGQGPLAELAGQGPALLLVDVTLPIMAFALRARGLPQALVHTSLPQTRDPGVPPLRSGTVYRGSWAGRLRAAVEWRGFLAKRSLSARLVAPLGMCPPYELSRRTAPQFAVEPGDLDRHTVYMPQLRGLRELVLCPEVFDFPRPSRPDRHYVESVDLERREIPFPWERLSPGLPLVYASLGSQVYQAQAARRFLQRLAALFRRRPEWQLVLATGRHLAPGAVEAASPNMVVVERAPQLALLQRAQVMVTHGGLGSIKECILHGVPMLVFPLEVDQPGNAARVAYHGLGRVGSLADDEGVLSWRLQQVLHDEGIRGRILRMQQDFLQVEQMRRGAALVEQWTRAV